MQDKEFDRLFNSKLDDFEIEPSPMVWDNIASELHGKAAKRSVVPYLSIAASVILLVSVGLLFFKQNEDAPVKPGKRNITIAKINKSVIPDSVPTSRVTRMPMIAKVQVSEDATPPKHTAYRVPKLNDKELVNQIIAKANDRVMTYPTATYQPELAITPVQKEPVMVVPDKETSLAVIATDKQIETITTETTFTETMQTSVKKRGIHSLGGLIGALVAKVDKREDKLIEFTESEENGSTITGLNLGLIKIKKK